MDVTICVATFGDESWIDLAEGRAIPSAQRFGVPVVHMHRDTLHDARNAAVAEARTEWVCHLDADDELEAGYFAAMAEVDGDLRPPSVRYVRGHQFPAPIMPKVAGHHHDCEADCLPFGNWLVVGTLVRSEMVVLAGGWRDFDWSEDWDLWVRCRALGATITPAPSAVYRAHVRQDSRNRAAPPSQRLAAHRAIAEANGLPVPA